MTSLNDDPSMRSRCLLGTWKLATNKPSIGKRDGEDIGKCPRSWALMCSLFMLPVYCLIEGSRVDRKRNQIRLKCYLRTDG